MKIDSTKCLGCHTCQGVCPMGAMGIDEDGKAVIDSTKCMNCGACATMCPVNAINH